jgi:hypothetical protein
MSSKRHSNCLRLSDTHVARLEAHRKALGLTRRALLQKFEEALKKNGCIHTKAAAKMRLDRILNRRMRRPMSEETKASLAAAFECSIPQLETVMGVSLGSILKTSTQVSGHAARELKRDFAAIKLRLRVIEKRVRALSRRHQ